VSPIKKILFSFVTVVLFVLLLFLAEGVLRLADYGGDTSLFVAKGSGDSARYELNPNFMQRYFFKKGITPPDPRSQSFALHKSPQTYRIFCLGASTTQGVPYPPNASFPAMLGHILKSIHPQRDFEIVNCGVTAITSHSVLDMGLEIVERYDPDLLIVYSGHNEFYGALGSASRLTLFDSRELTRLFLGLQRSRLFLLLRNSYISLFGESIDAGSVIDPATLMGTVAKEAEIPLDSPLLKRTAEHYRANLLDLADAASGKEVPVLLCTLADNLRDLPPLGSQASEKLNGPAREELLKQVQAGERLYNEGAPDAAIRNLEVALQIDSSYAEAHYWLARNLLAKGQKSRALSAFIRARDLDVIRFRAPSRFNAIIKEVAGFKGLPVADIFSAFVQTSADSVPGENLILEHIHPNATGYYAMAKTIALTMSESRLVAPLWDWSPALSDSAYLAMNKLTTLSHEVANMAAFRLKNHWPFTHSGRPVAPYRRVGNAQTEKLARLYVFERALPLHLLHLDYGYSLFSEGDLAGARAEYEASLAIEKSCEGYNRLGLLETALVQDYARSQKQREAALRFQKGLTWYQRGLDLCPDYAPLYFNRGQLFSLLPRSLDRAESDFREALKLDPQHLNARTALVQLLLRRQRANEAAKLLQDGLRQNPGEVSFMAALARIQAAAGNIAEARQWIDQALQLKPDDKELLQFSRQLGTLQ